jgi:hypothetical protein
MTELRTESPVHVHTLLADAFAGLAMRDTVHWRITAARDNQLEAVSEEGVRVVFRVDGFRLDGIEKGPRRDVLSELCRVLYMERVRFPLMAAHPDGLSRTVMLVSSPNAVSVVPLPPPITTYLLWYLPKARRETVMGDLEEEYATVYRAFGKRKALLWYYTQVLTSFGPEVASKVRALAKWGAIGWVAEVIRQIIT